ncbi:MAG: radical SAM protein [Desulfobacteraceae bacterium]
MNKNHTVLLIQPPIRDFYFTRKRSIPYGLACIAAGLEKEGFHVIILDALASSKTRERSLPSEMSYLQPFYGRPDLSPFSLFHGYKHYGLSYEAIGKKAAESEAFLVGISSLFTSYSHEALETARVVKKHLPSCTVVMGGHHPTHLPEEVLKEPAVDFVIRGEGERAMVELALALKAGRSVDISIEGVAFKTNHGEIHTSQPTFIADPDDFPAPSMDLVDQAFYGRKNGGSTVVTASRGCPMTCSYCCVAAPSSCYRRRNVDDVYGEICRAVFNHNARFIDFEDENLTLDKSWCIDLFSRISSELGHLNIELRAMNGLYAPSLDDELIRTMHKAGFKALNLSLCSLSKDQLKRFGRRDVRKAYEAALESLNKRDMDSVTYILVGAPGQSPLESLDDLVYLAGMDTLCGVSVYYPAPGSRDYDMLRQRGALPPSFSMMRSSAIPISGSTSRLQSITLLRLGRIVNFAKDLKKKGIPIIPMKLEDHAVLEPSDRTETGLALIQSFFHDSRIRGIDRDGHVYTHEVDEALCCRFIFLAKSKLCNI